MAFNSRPATLSSLWMLICPITYVSSIIPLTAHLSISHSLEYLHSSSEEGWKTLVFISFAFSNPIGPLSSPSLSSNLLRSKRRATMMWSPEHVTCLEAVFGAGIWNVSWSAQPLTMWLTRCLDLVFQIWLEASVFTRSLCLRLSSRLTNRRDMLSKWRWSFALVNSVSLSLKCLLLSLIDCLAHPSWVSRTSLSTERAWFHSFSSFNPSVISAVLYSNGHFSQNCLAFINVQFISQKSVFFLIWAVLIFVLVKK